MSRIPFNKKKKFFQEYFYNMGEGENYRKIVRPVGAIIVLAIIVVIVVVIYFLTIE